MIRKSVGPVVLRSGTQTLRGGSGLFLWAKSFLSRYANCHRTLGGMSDIELKDTRAASPVSRRFNGLRPALALLAFVMLLVAAPQEAQAENLIKQPGAHNRYSFELEPRIGLYYGGYGWRGRYRDRDRFYCCGPAAAFGPGVHASIPFMHNGPIDSINNNIAINFGIDTYFPGGTAIISLPAAFQWNFYFTDIISVLGEVGFVSNIWTGYGGFFEMDPLIQGGGRFQFGKVGVIVRVGWPILSVGANIQF